MINNCFVEPVPVPSNQTKRRKEEEIDQILSQDEIDLWALRELCLTEGGLVNGVSLCS